MIPATFGLRLTYAILALVVAGVQLGVDGEHLVDLSVGSGAEAPFLQQQAYLIPFRAVETAKYLSALKRHKRSSHLYQYEVPRQVEWDMEEPASVPRQGYLVHRDYPLIYM